MCDDLARATEVQDGKKNFSGAKSYFPHASHCQRRKHFIRRTESMSCSAVMQVVSHWTVKRNDMSNDHLLELRLPLLGRARHELVAYAEGGKSFRTSGLSFCGMTG